MEVVYFDKSIEKFVDSLESDTQTKIVRMIDLLEYFGHLISMPYSKPLGSSMYELRIRGRQEVRLVYVFHGNSAVILHGFSKNLNKYPSKK